MKIIKEDMIQLLHVGSDTKLTPAQISDVINRAYAYRTYAKFYTDNVFIQVNFDRLNQQISVSSNIRTLSFVNDLWRHNNYGWNLSRVKAFVYQWMQISRRLLY